MLECKTEGFISNEEGQQKKFEQIAEQILKEQPKTLLMSESLHKQPWDKVPPGRNGQDKSAR